MKSLFTLLSKSYFIRFSFTVVSGSEIACYIVISYLNAKLFINIIAVPEIADSKHRTDTGFPYY